MISLFFSFPGITQQKAYSITGTTNGAEGKWLYIGYRDEMDQSVVDSAMVGNHSFRFSGFIPSTIAVSFSCRTCGQAAYTRLFIEPAAMKLTLDTANFEKAKLTGSRTQQEYEAYQDAREYLYRDMRPIQARYEASNDVYRAAHNRGNASIDELDSLAKITKSIDAEFDPLRKGLDKEDRIFLNKYPRSIVNAYYLNLSKGGIKLDSLQVYFDRFGFEAQQSMYGRSIGNYINKKRNAVPDTTAKNFSAIDIDGKLLHLADFRGKYVLLDFWASWCVPCREQSPHMKELYRQYRSKGLEIIGVADNDGEDRLWKAAVKKDGLPWKQVLRGRSETKEKNENDISSLFGVGSLPTYILINPSGKIAGRFGGGGEPHEALDKKLADSFK
jgi:thiol-disulfide isomerase/thioredoxin